MSTSDMNKKRSGKMKREGLRKTVIVYLVLSITAIVVDNIYAQFGHGVRSTSMSFMFLYPLLGGAMIYFLLGIAIPNITAAKPFRLGYNLYNSGIATLTTGSFFKGILDIAGTASEYTKAFMLIGVSFTVAGMIVWIAAVIKVKAKLLSPVMKG